MKVTVFAEHTCRAGYEVPSEDMLDAEDGDRMDWQIFEGSPQELLAIAASHLKHNPQAYDFRLAKTLFDLVRGV